MSERWEEIEEQIQGQARLIEVENGVERDPIECMELACKRIAEAEAEVDRMADGREATHAELEALGFKSDIQGGPEDSLVRVAKLVRERFYAHERPRIAELEAEVARLEAKAERLDAMLDDAKGLVRDAYDEGRKHEREEAEGLWRSWEGSDSLRCVEELEADLEKARAEQ